MKQEKQYGDLPTMINIIEVGAKEMMFYQYLPIKMKGELCKAYEVRLRVFEDIISKITIDFINCFGLEAYRNHYMYITAKHMYQGPDKTFNRGGYHSDGFMTNDINYIWSDCNPTVFNKSNFKLTQDDSLSLQEMELQAIKVNEVVYPDNAILRLNQYNIHKVNDNPVPGMRTFLKISFSKDKYDLEGNSHNYLMDYNWDMKKRKEERNIPQTRILTNN